ncbi:MAG TPA: ATP-binding protein [Chthoniobacteraceae bacterium]|jgi:signal transduction histidine kinase/ActR/RegA family two-component response regulator|nr:ATP-binding protein [Chthoniobacteraceae bacterium]
MKVQSKILLLLLAVVAVFSGGLLALKITERRVLQRMGRERAIERDRAFDEFLSERGDKLSAVVDDASIWTDMARACAQSDRPWIDRNENFETLSTYDLNAVWVYKPDGTLLFSRNNRYAKDLDELPVPPASIASHLSRDRTCHFFFKVRQGWMEIRGATIHQSDDPGRVTTPQGYFFAGRIWIDENIRRMVMFTGYSIRIVPRDEVIPQKPSEEERGLITFSRLLPGWDGQPVAQLQVQHDSPIVREMNRMAERLFYWLIAAACLISLILAGALMRWVRRPLRIISHCLESGDSHTLERLRGEPHELGKLSALILRSRQTESELRDTEELLRHSQKLEAVGRLAGGVAHDFNNLLTAIIGYSELLELKLKGQPEYCEQAVLIRRAGERAAGLTRQLLAFSRKQLLQPVVLDLNELIRDMEKLLQRVIGEHIVIRLELAGAEMRVLADATQLEQVILNLGVNARDAMTTGGMLRITTERKVVDPEHPLDDERALAPGEYVQICVIDTGYGMNRETQMHIFEPFFTTKGVGKGTGLGLATVYGIVKQSGGGISVKSEQGEGTTFCIYLPRVDSPLEPAKAAPAQVAHELHGETVLVLEDEEVVRDLLCAVLQDAGYRVLCAAAPSEALERTRAHAGPIDLLVSDVILPEMHGPVIARLLTEMKPGIKVLFVSGYSENDISEQGVLEPGVEVLQKPFSQQDLLLKIDAMLNEPAGAAVS